MKQDETEEDFVDEEDIIDPEEDGSADIEYDEEESISEDIIDVELEEAIEIPNIENSESEDIEIIEEEKIAASSFQTFAGNTISSATSISLGTEYRGSLTSTNSIDYYKFTLGSSGRVTFTASAGMKWIYYSFYDSAGNQLWRKNPQWNSTTETISTGETFDLTKGTYYFAVQKDGSYTGSYKFKLAFKSAGESFTETGNGSNNSMSTANQINLNQNYKGQLALNDEKDFYKFTLSSSGRITLTASAQMKWIYYHIYDSSGNQLWRKNPQWNSTTETISTGETFDLTKGTYYLAVQKDGSYTGTYSFKLSFKSAEESFTETGSGSNNSMSKANKISLNTTYKGQLAVNDEKDFYKFTMGSSGNITFNATAVMERVYCYIYNSSGKQVWGGYQYWNSTTGKIKISETIKLSKGTYYLAIERASSHTGTYNFSMNYGTSISKCSISLSSTKYSYTGREKKPAVKVKKGSTTLKSGTHYTVSYSSNKNVGTGKVTIKGKGSYYGSVSKSFTIRPKATTISKLTAKSKGFTAKWKKQTSQVTGYQIQYSTSSKFSSKKTKTISKNSTTSGTYKKLKGSKKYYVRIRTYKTVSGKKYYSTWSKAKMVTTKR